MHNKSIISNVKKNIAELVIGPT